MVSLDGERCAAVAVGSGTGLFGMPGPPAEIITGLLMLAGLILGVGGAGRVAR